MSPRMALASTYAAAAASPAVADLSCDRNVVLAHRHPPEGPSKEGRSSRHYRLR